MISDQPDAKAKEIADVLPKCALSLPAELLHTQH